MLSLHHQGTQAMGFPTLGWGGGGGRNEGSLFSPHPARSSKRCHLIPCDTSQSGCPPPNPFSPPLPFFFHTGQKGGGGNPQIPDPAKKVRKNSEEAPDLGRDGWKWERVCHAASSGRAPSRPQRALTHASLDDRTEGNGGDPAGLSLGRNPALFVQRFTQRSVIYPSPFWLGRGMGGGGRSSTQAGSRPSLLAGQRRSDLVLQLIPPWPVPELQLRSGFYAAHNSF